MEDDVSQPTPQTRRVRLRLMVLLAVAVVLAVVASTASGRGQLRDVVATTHIEVAALGASHRSHRDRQARPVPGEYQDMVASGRQAAVLKYARKQLGVKYVLGARPRHRWSLALVGGRRVVTGMDCSTFVAYAFLNGAHTWISGFIAHTDQIWTQGGKLPLKLTAEKTSRILRGPMSAPPPGGFQPGDLIFTRSGAGGYWGHVMMVSEHGRVIESFPPDVHETRSLESMLDRKHDVAWMRIRALG